MPISQKRKTVKRRTAMARSQQQARAVRGRPGRKYPPRIDATAEEIGQAMFALPADHQWEYEKGEGKVYRCVDCKREVWYPETLYRDGRCEKCKKAAAE